MDTIVAILRAAHCKSTHYYFAIDSLFEVPSDRGKSLADLLLANYSDYLKGAKDPDNVFKDFENHVLHVRDGYWGGAAKTAEKWLERSFRLISAGNWKEAAYAIGVLSHYFTDPFMPLHTAQSTRETIVHRPLEWSVCWFWLESGRNRIWLDERRQMCLQWFILPLAGWKPTRLSAELCVASSHVGA